MSSVVNNKLGFNRRDQALELVPGEVHGNGEEMIQENGDIGSSLGTGRETGNGGDGNDMEGYEIWE